MGWVVIEAWLNAYLWSIRLHVDVANSRTDYTDQPRRRPRPRSRSRPQPSFDSGGSLSDKCLSKFSPGCTARRGGSGSVWSAHSKIGEMGTHTHWQWHRRSFLGDCGWLSFSTAKGLQFFLQFAILCLTRGCMGRGRHSTSQNKYGHNEEVICVWVTAKREEY